MAGTVVAILVLAGGYVVAASLTGIFPSQTSQNAGSVGVPGDTIFASHNVTSINIVLVEGLASNCGVSVPWSSTNFNISVFMMGTDSCLNGTIEWFEEVTWTGVHSPGVGQSDVFFITTESSGPTYNYVAFTVADQTALDGAFADGILHVYLAAGPATDGDLPVAYTSISIAVSGT